MVAAITAFGVHGSVMFATLTTTTALASMFGVVGGGLGAYKMSKRVRGLTEWKIRKETSCRGDNDKVTLTGLHATVCVSGWLASESDFQTPFGLQANDPCMPNRETSLARFFAVRAPNKLPQVRQIIEEKTDKKNKKNPLAAYWKELEEEYGENPDHMLPLDPGSPPQEETLSTEMQASIYNLLVQHCLTEEAAERLKELWESSTMLVQMEAKNREVLGSNDADEAADVEIDPLVPIARGVVNETTQSYQADLELAAAAAEIRKDEANAVVAEADPDMSISEDDSAEIHSHVVWDWHATYSGELYTVTWETSFLLKLCRVATVLFLELSDQLSKQILTQSLVGATLALPSALLTCSSVIDDPYQIIVLRSKKAGIELARCLLTSDEHRPISLVGFSFGARVIFDCLLELERHQKIWQERHDPTDDASSSQSKKSSDHIEYRREPASIVEDVVLIGMPRTIDVEAWIKCREIVAGRLVNCYNRKDWIVSYMINVRCAGGIRKTCGAHPVENVTGVENCEVSDLASTHGRYLVAVPQILEKVGYSQPRAFELDTSMVPSIK